MRTWLLASVGLAVSLLAVEASGAPIVFSASGANAAAIQATVDSFRAALGSLNPNVVGSFGSGRREINWDGVPNGVASPNALPGEFFNVNSPRGVVLSTPGTGFEVSANAGIAPVEFGNINPNYPAQFATFSAQRLFTALGSTITDVQFFVPGTGAAAGTTGFGAVFTDVDLPNSTSLQFFDIFGASLGVFLVPAAQGDGTLSFLGVTFSPELIGRVRVTSGNQVLGPGSGGDEVVMDDFIYGEPNAVVPEPTTALLLLTGTALGLAKRRRSNR